MKVHDVYNILLHILFLFSILTGLFWVIISKEMDDQTSDSLTGGVNNTVTDILSTLKDSKEPYPEVCKYVIQNKQSINTYIETQLKQKPTKNEKTSYNNKLKQTNYIIIGVVFALTLGSGIWLEIHNKKSKGNPDNEYYTWWRILLINIGLFIGVGICEAIFFLFIASKYTPINSTDAKNSVLTQIIKSLNTPTSK